MHSSRRRLSLLRCSTPPHYLTDLKHSGVVLAEEESEEFLAEMLTQIRFFTLASHLWWGLWGAVQTKHSKIQFPFKEYSDRRLEVFALERKRLEG